MHTLPSSYDGENNDSYGSDSAVEYNCGDSTGSDGARTMP